MRGPGSCPTTGRSWGPRGRSERRAQSAKAGITLDLTDLRIFRAVAESGSFSRAAQLLFLAQPSVSHRIAALERETGTQLFTRTGRGVHLTPAGSLFLGYARAGLESIDQGRRAIAQYLLGRSGSLALGCATTAATHILPQLLRGYIVGHPDVDVRVRTGRSLEVLALLTARQVDVALVRLEVHQGELTSEVLLREPVCLVAPPDHPLARRKAPVRAGDLHGTSLLTYYRESEFWTQVYGAAEQVAGPIHRAMELDSLDAVRSMALAGLGLAFLPHSSVQSDIAEGRLCRLQVTDVALPDRITTICRRCDTPFVGPVAEIWAEIARSYGQSVS